MNRQTNMVLVLLSNSACKCLSELLVNVHRKPSGSRLMKTTHISAIHHLFCDILDSALIPRLASILLKRVDFCQVGFQEFDIASVCKAYIFNLAHFLPFPIWVAESVEEGSAEIRCVCDIGHLIQLIWQRDGHKISQSTEVNLGEALCLGQQPKVLTI